jgi:acetyl esterase/lipase
MKQCNYLVLLTCIFFLSNCKKNNNTDAIAPTVVIPDRTIKNDLAYATLHNAQKLDVYTPAAVGPYPVVVLIHGGGWVQGDKGEYKTSQKTEALLLRGYAVVAINYRLSFVAKFPAQIQDVKAAIRWIKANAAAYNLNPNKIGAWGTSAGGHLTALLATSGTVTTLEDLTLGDATKSSKIQAAIDWFGPTDLLQMDAQTIAQGCGTTAATHNGVNSPESQLMGYAIQTQRALVQLANPIHYVTNEDTPIYIEHGIGDCTVPYNQGKILYDSLVAVKGTTDVKFKLLTASGHGTGQFETIEAVNAMIDFLDVYLK